MTLRPGQTLRSATGGGAAHILERLGGGGQGEVWRAAMSGREVAVKWYFPHVATPAQRDIIAGLVRTGRPDARFLWPEDLLEESGGFGYAMPIRAPQMCGIVALMTGRVDPSFDALTRAAYELVESFLHLHARGLCYRDISFGNVFFDPQTGHIQICDNDNVGVDGQSEVSVVGTPRFMAPEVVTGEARPSTQTDLWSLAVLLFYLLVVHHPLEGALEARIKCLDLPAMTRLYGTDPRFIFHPTDRSNLPLAGLHDNALTYWPLLPERLQALFVRTFTEGVHDPGRRARESEWRSALVALRDQTVTCDACGAEVFRSGRDDACWGCNRPITPRFTLTLHTGPVALVEGRELTPHHTTRRGRYELTPVVARVSRHPTRPKVLGLTNLSGRPWRGTRPDGSSFEVADQRSIELQDGLTVDFGDAQGVVVG